MESLAANRLGEGLWMKSGDEADLARYLAEVAWNEPGQLPWVMAEVVRQRVMLDVVLAVQESMLTFFDQWEESLNELIQGMSSRQGF